MFFVFLETGDILWSLDISSVLKGPEVEVANALSHGLDVDSICPNSDPYCCSERPGFAGNLG